MHRRDLDQCKTALPIGTHMITKKLQTYRQFPQHMYSSQDGGRERRKEGGKEGGRQERKEGRKERQEGTEGTEGAQLNKNV